MGRKTARRAGAAARRPGNVTVLSGLLQLRYIPPGSIDRKVLDGYDEAVKNGEYPQPAFPAKGGAVGGLLFGDAGKV